MRARTWGVPAVIVIVVMGAVVARQLQLDEAVALAGAQRGLRLVLRFLWPLLVPVAVWAWLRTRSRVAGALALSALCIGVMGVVPGGLRPVLFTLYLWGLVWVVWTLYGGLPRALRWALLVLAVLPAAENAVLLVLQAAQPPMYIVHFVAPVLGGLQVNFWGVLLAAAHSGRRAAHRTAVTGWLMWYAGVQGLATLSAALAGVFGLLSPVLSLGALVCLAGALWAAAQRPAASRRGP